MLWLQRRITLNWSVLSIWSKKKMLSRPCSKWLLPCSRWRNCKLKSVLNSPLFSMVVNLYTLSKTPTCLMSSFWEPSVLAMVSTFLNTHTSLRKLKMMKSVLKSAPSPTKSWSTLMISDSILLRPSWTMVSESALTLMILVSSVTTVSLWISSSSPSVLN